MQAALAADYCWRKFAEALASDPRAGLALEMRSERLTMAQDTIQEFLVNLGFKVDEATWGRFERTIESATLKARIFGDVLEGMARTVAEKSKPSRAILSSSPIKARGWEPRRRTLKLFGLRSRKSAGPRRKPTPCLRGSAARCARIPRGMEQYLRTFGIQTRDAAGHLLDSSDILLNAGKKFNDLVKANPLAGQAQAARIAETLGLGGGSDAVVLERQADLWKLYNKALESAEIGGDQ